MAQSLTNVVKYTLREPVGISQHRDMNHLTFFGKIGLINHGRRIASLLSREEKNRRTIDLCMCMHNGFS